MRWMPPVHRASKGLVLSLFDYTGVWARPWHENGYTVALVDLKHGDDMSNGRTLEALSLLEGVVGILAAPPCDHFAGSGARWWKAKDADGRTQQGIDLVQNTLWLIHRHQDKGTLKWWALENPVGRLARLVPEVGPKRLTFHPYHYAGWSEAKEGEAYTKKTILWGDFNPNLPKHELEPVMHESAGKRGSWMWKKLGGKSERTKALRSATPEGFAWAFYWAQEVGG